MDVKDTFIKLTEYLIPYGEEERLVPFLPSGVQKDSSGNYFIKVGETKTMFTCHMDNFTSKLRKVNHEFFVDDKGRNKVKTDGKTPLGADDKAGMTVMLYMIENGIPGYYYFFIGEEPILSGGCKGSKDAFAADPEFFKQFDRCIAFDRRGYGSIISRQYNGVCCSKDFVEALAAEFNNAGMAFKDDPTGRRTDSAIFMYTIPEVTNLSCGGFHEHTMGEFQNLDYLERLCVAVTKINWEGLPTVRVPRKPILGFEPRRKTFKKSTTSTSKKEAPVKSAADVPVEKPLNVDVKSEIQKYKDKVKARKAEDQKGKPDLGLFKYKTFMKKKGIELYKTIKDYLEYYGYKSIKFDEKWNNRINCTFLRLDKNAPESKYINSYQVNVEIDGQNIKLSDINITFNDLNDFEKILDIGFAPKFYKYTEEFVNDLREARKKYGFRLGEDIVNKILSKYGNFTIIDIIRNYKELFDEDDFRYRWYGDMIYVEV